MASSITLPPLPIDTQIFTFYSFKGGVGRSMALVNTAAQLARGGRKVLIVDLDLEAPGVSYLAKQGNALPSKGGFVDVLYDFLTDGEESALGSSLDINPFRDYTMSLNLTATAQGEGGGTVDVMPSGKLTDLSEYQRRVGFMEFNRLYREGLGAPLLLHFREKLRSLKNEDHYDYILVDSRTGFTTESTIAVRDLADHLMIVMGLNHQNVEGTCGFLRVLNRENIRLQSMTFIFSPVPLGEDELAEQRIKTAREQINKAWPRNDISMSIGRFIIPYHPRLALDESPHKARLTNQVLTSAYRVIYEQVRRLTKDSVADYVRKVQHLLDSSLAAEALPYVARLIIEEHNRGIDFARRALLLAKSARIQNAYIDLLRPDAKTSLDTLEAVAAVLKAKTLMSEGVKIYDSYIEVQPNQGIAWMLKGVFLESFNPIEATNCFLKATELSPNDPQVLNKYASHLWEVRNLEIEASKAFQEWSKYPSHNSIQYANYAEFCISLGDYDSAKEALLDSWGLNSYGDWPGHLLFCASIYSRLTQDTLSEVLQLRRIKRGINQGLRSPQSRFDALLKHVSHLLDEQGKSFYIALSSVIINALPKSHLDIFSGWVNIKNTGKISGRLFPAKDVKK